MPTHLAIDLGASSGRIIAGTPTDDGIHQEEMYRFDNPILRRNGGCYWDLNHLFESIVEGLKRCAQRYGSDIASIGIDTWGVDVVLFRQEGSLLIPIDDPHCYRDGYTTPEVMRQVFDKVPRETIYQKTGIQFMNFNTLFQLAALSDSARSADKILFMPDALSYLLTGKAVCEETICSTSQFMNLATRLPDADLLAALGLHASQFGEPVKPGTPIGTLLPSICQRTGLKEIPVIAVAGHDTASAVAAVPSSHKLYTFLSCGTWSLLGSVIPSPIVTPASYEANFTNEGGIFGTTRFLKNICGLWLLERCRQEWDDAPDSVAQLCAEAEAAVDCGARLNPDDPLFANPDSMTQAIDEHLKASGQSIPQGYAQTARCIFESLALRYAQVLRQLEELTGRSDEELHIIGGGSQNAFLMQLTANATRRTVIAGPAESTALGNILMQLDQTRGDNLALRRMAALSSTRTFIPKEC